MWIRIHSGDARAVREVQRGNAEAFGRLVRRYLGPAHAVAYAIAGNREDAEDIAQEAFLKAFRSLQSLREPAKFGPWLVRIVRNTALSMVSARRRETTVPLDENFAAETPEPGREEVRGLLRRRIMELEPEAREILLLHYYGGRNTSEIAVLLGITRHAAKKRLQRARQTLGRALLAELQPAVAPETPESKRASAILAACLSTRDASAAAGTLAAASLGASGLIWKAGAVAVLVLMSAAAATWMYGTATSASGTLERPVADAEAAPSALGANETPPRPEKGLSTPETAQATGVLRGPGKVFGSVVDDGGNPVPGAAVVLEQIDWDHFFFVEPGPVRRSATSDAEGRFSFEGLPKDYFVVHATADAGIAYDQVRLPHRAGLIEVRLVLKPAAAVAGAVHGPDGEAVPGAVAFPVESGGEALDRSFRWPYTLRVETDATGAFRFPALWKDPVKLWVRAQGYAPVLAGPFTPGRDRAVVPLTRGGSVEGRVVDETGNGIAGVDILFSSATNRELLRAQSGDSGAFRASGLRPATYRAVVSDDEWAHTGAVASFPVREGETASLQLSAVPGAVVTGTVFDAVTGRGVSGVTLMGGRDENPALMRMSAPTDAQGRFRVTGLVGGRACIFPYRVAGYARSVNGEVRPLQLSPGQEISGVDFPLVRGEVATGRVIDSEGRPLPSVYVRMDTRDRKKVSGDWTDESGSFEVQGFAAGDEVVVGVMKDGYGIPPWPPYTIRAGGLQGLEFRLSREGVIEGTVVDAAGRPAREATVTANLEGEGEQDAHGAEVDSKGAFRIDRLPPGRYALTAYTPSGSRSAEPGGPGVAVAAGQRIRGIRLQLDVDLERLLAISGRVADAQGRPVEGAELSCNGPGSTSKAISVPDGRYRLERLLPGQYTVSVTHPQWTPDAREYVEAGGEGVDFVLAARGKLVGRVVEAGTGKPIPRFNAGLNPRESAEVHTSLERVLPREPIDAGAVWNEEGRFEITGIPAGAWNAGVTAEGFALRAQEVDIRPGDQGPTVLVLELQRERLVTGIVRDPAGAPLAGAHVFLSSASTTSGVDGAFILRGLADLSGSPGPVTLGANHPEQGRTSVEVSAAQLYSERVVVAFQSAGRVTGRVTRNGQPLVDVFVSLGYTDKGALGSYDTHTDDQGFFTLDTLPPGNAALRVNASWAGEGQRSVGVDFADRILTVAAGKETRADVEVPYGNGTVVGSASCEGRPAAGAFVRVSYRELQAYALAFHTQTDDTGAYRIDGMPPGVVDIDVQPFDEGGHYKHADAVRVGDGETVLPEFHLPPIG